MVKLKIWAGLLQPMYVVWAWNFAWGYCGNREKTRHTDTHTGELGPGWVVHSDEGSYCQQPRASLFIKYITGGLGTKYLIVDQAQAVNPGGRSCSC